MIQQYEPDPKYLQPNELGPVYDPRNEMRYDLMSAIEFYRDRPMPSARSLLRMVIGLLLMVVFPEGLLLLIGVLQFYRWWMRDFDGVGVLSLLGFLLMIFFSLVGGLLFSVHPPKTRDLEDQDHRWRVWFWRIALIHLAMYSCLLTFLALGLAMGQPGVPQIGMTGLGLLWGVIVAPGLMIIALAKYMRCCASFLPFQSLLKGLGVLCWLIYLTGVLCWLPLWFSYLYWDETDLVHFLTLPLALPAGLVMVVLLLTFWVVMLYLMHRLFQLWRMWDELAGLLQVQKLREAEGRSHD